MRKSWQSSLTGKVGPVGEGSGNTSTSDGQSRPALRSSNCVCNRPRQIVMCQQCGHMFEGRVRRPCSSHPSITFLLDIVGCINCKMDDLDALKEFPMRTVNSKDDALDIGN